MRVKLTVIFQTEIAPSVLKSLQFTPVNLFYSQSRELSSLIINLKTKHVLLRIQYMQNIYL